MVLIDDNDRGKRYVEIEAMVEHITEDAVLLDDGTWIPISCLEDWPDVGETGIVMVEEWFAIKKEIV